MSRVICILSGKAKTPINKTLTLEMQVNIQCVNRHTHLDSHLKTPGGEQGPVHTHAHAHTHTLKTH